MSLDDLIRIRCDARLKAKLEQLAAADRRDLSQLVRVILEDYVADMERVALHETPPTYTAAPADELTAEEKRHLAQLRARAADHLQRARDPSKPGK